MKAPLVPVTLAFLAGILVGMSAWIPPWSLVVVGVVSAGVALWGRRHARSGIIALLLLWGCLGALRVAAWSAHPDARLAAQVPEEPQPVRVHAVVAHDPTGFFEPGEPARLRAVLRLRHRRTEAGWEPVSGQVLATVQEPREPLAYGDELLVEGEWSRVPPPGNPGEYDWRAALARERIHGMLRVRPFDGFVVLAHGRGSPFLAAVFALRRRWERLIDAAFSARDAGLLRSLLLGERGPIEERLKRAFVDTGTVHIVPTQMGRKYQSTPASHVTL